MLEVKAILGGGTIALGNTQLSLEEAQRLLDLCTAYGVDTIDTARYRPAGS